VSKDEEPVILVGDVNISPLIDDDILRLGGQFFGKESPLLLRCGRDEIGNGLGYTRGADVVKPEASALVAEMDDMIYIRQTGLMVGHVDIVGPELSSQVLEIPDSQFLRRNRNWEIAIGFGFSSFFISTTKARLSGSRSSSRMASVVAIASFLDGMGK
jgi:hypothetical protein